MREVSRDQFFAAVGRMNVHPRSERDASYWETPTRKVMGRTEPGYMCEGPKRYFLATPTDREGGAGHE